MSISPSSTNLQSMTRKLNTHSLSDLDKMLTSGGRLFLSATTKTTQRCLSTSASKLTMSDEYPQDGLKFDISSLKSDFSTVHLRNKRYLKGKRSTQKKWQLKLLSLFVRTGICRRQRESINERLGVTRPLKWKIRACTQNITKNGSTQGPIISFIMVEWSLCPRWPLS